MNEQHGLMVSDTVGKYRVYSGIGLLSIMRYFILCLVLACAVSGWAQGTGRGTISGTVIDATGAVIPGASIQVREVNTNVSIKTESNGTGYFEAPQLLPGTYEITVSHAGFSSYVQKGIVLLADTHPSVPIHLVVSSSGETIVVTADALLLNTDSGLGGQVLTTKDIESFPVSGGNASYLAKLSPLVQAADPQNQYMAGNLNANSSMSSFGIGGRVTVNEFSLDGAPNNGNNHYIAYGPAVDEVGEMKTEVSGFDASIGHTMGVYLTQTSKTGTNMIHGTIRELYDDRAWEAMQHFQRVTFQTQVAAACANGETATCKSTRARYDWPHVHENNFGASVGGPVFVPKIMNGKDKLFFFVGTTQDIYTDAASSSATVPTAQERGGDFSDIAAPTTAPASYVAACGTNVPYYGAYQIYNPYSVTVSGGHPTRQPFCGNVIPSAYLSKNGMVSALTSRLPSPNSAVAYQGASSNNYLFTNLKPQTYRAITNRFDYTPNEANRFFFRWTWMNYGMRQTYVLTDKFDQQNTQRHVKEGVFGYIHSFSPNTVLDATAGATEYFNYGYYPNMDAAPPSKVGLPSYMDQYAGKYAEFPYLTFNGYTAIGGADAARVYFRSLAFRSNILHITGRHSMHAGVEWRQQNAAGGGPGNPSGIFAFDQTYTQHDDGSQSTTYPVSTFGLTYASFLMGIPTTSQAATSPSYSRSTPYYAFYAGDTWRMTPKITLIPGIRFEYEYGPTEKHNQQIVGFDPKAQLPIASAAQAAYIGSTLANLPSGVSAAQLPTSINVQGGPIYAGVNGASTRQWENSYRILPRIALAYQLTPKTVIRTGYGLFFDTNNALSHQGTINQDGYATSTTDASSSSFGTDFVLGKDILADPFPATNGVRFNPAIGNAAGSAYYIGSSANFYDHNLVPARMQRFQVSVQRQLNNSLMLELNYTGSLTTNITVNNNSNTTQTNTNAAAGLSYVPASYYGTGNTPATSQTTLLNTAVTNPFNIGNFSSLSSSNAIVYQRMQLNSFFTSKTTSIANLVRNYAQMGGSFYGATGESKFHSVSASLTKRFSRGYSFNAAIQMNNQWDRDWFANPFDASPTWEPTNLSRPYRVTVNGVYELPFGRNRKFVNTGLVASLLGGFQIDGSYELQPGALVSFPNAFLTADPSSVALKSPTYGKWFNTGAFNTLSTAQPTSYNVRAMPNRLAGVRQQGPNTVYANMQRNLKIYENVGLQMRFECFNLFNRNIIGAPNTTVTSSSFGTVTSDGTGYARWVQIQGRLTF